MDEGAELKNFDGLNGLDANDKILVLKTNANKVGWLPASQIDASAWCGREWTIDDANPIGTPIGDLDMLKELPSLLGLGGYLVQNDHTRQKLDPTNHSKLKNGGANVLLDGSAGHYMWGWNTSFYYTMHEKYGKIREIIKFSPYPGQMNNRIPVASYAAAGVSPVVGDKLIGAGTGMPTTSISVDTAAADARANGSFFDANWRSHYYMIGALARIILGSRSIQYAYSDTLDANGCYQCGLGGGIDYREFWDSAKSGYIDLSAGVEKGDMLGIFSFSRTNAAGEAETLNNIPNFFGLKNFYKYLWMMQRQILIQWTSKNSYDVYVKPILDNTDYNINSLSGLTKILSVDNIPAEWSYIKKMSGAYLCGMATELGASESTFYGDGLYNPSVDSGLRGVLAAGSADNGDLAGALCVDGDHGPSDAYVDCGVALCETAEAWDATPFYAG